MKPEECSTAQEPTEEEIKTSSKDEEVPQQIQNGQGRVVDGELLQEPEPLNERIPVDTFAWCQGDDEGEDDKNMYKNRRSGKDTGFNLASSMDGFHIDTTGAIIQQEAKVLCETGHETVSEIALMKTR